MSGKKQAETQSKASQKPTEAELKVKAKAEVEEEARIEAEILAEEEAKAKAEEEAKAKDTPSAEDHEQLYSEYVALEFFKIAQEDSNKKLDEKHLETYEKLKKKALSYKGKKPVRTVFAAIGSEKVKLVKGVPVPESVQKLIEGAGKKVVEYYFG